MVRLYAPYCDRLNEIADRSSAIFDYDAARALEDSENAQVFSNPKAGEVVKSFNVLVRILQEGTLEAQNFKSFLESLKESVGVKGKDLFHPVRIALIGSHSGPDFDRLIPLIEEGSKLDLPVHVKSVRERVREFVAALDLRSAR